MHCPDIIIRRQCRYLHGMVKSCELLNTKKKMVSSDVFFMRLVRNNTILPTLKQACFTIQVRQVIFKKHCVAGTYELL